MQVQPLAEQRPQRRGLAQQIRQFGQRRDLAAEDLGLGAVRRSEIAEQRIKIERRGSCSDGPKVRIRARWGKNQAK